MAFQAFARSASIPSFLMVLAKAPEKTKRAPIESVRASFLSFTLVAYYWKTSLQFTPAPLDHCKTGASKGGELLLWDVDGSCQGLEGHEDT